MKRLVFLLAVVLCNIANAQTVVINRGGQQIPIVTNAGGANSWAAGLLSARPAAGSVGRFFYATDNQTTYYDNGSSWVAASAANVSSISGGTTGLTPSTATSGAITLSGTLATANGGTGLASYTVGALHYASAATTTGQLLDVATGNALISGGVGVAPSFGKIGLTTHVSGILPIANGGTNVSSVTIAPTATSFAGWDANKNLSANNHLEGFTTTATAAGTTTLVVGSTYQQYFTGTTTQTVILPTTSIIAGWQFQIVNQSTGVVTVNSSAGNLVVAMAANTSINVTSLIATPTTAANWSWQYSSNNNTTLSGSGTVTAIGVTTANGVSGTSSGGTAPNLTLSLGAITPTSTNGVSAATMAFNDATSSIQTQLNSKINASTVASTYVPYTGATGAVNLGGNNLKTNGGISSSPTSTNLTNQCFGQGSISNSTTSYNLAAGYNASANDASIGYGTAIGANSNVTSYYGTAIGYGATAANYSTAIGANSNASGASVVIGAGSNFTGGGSGTIIGYNSSSSVNYATIVGANISNTAVALGYNLNGGLINLGIFNTDTYGNGIMIGDNITTTAAGQLRFGNLFNGLGWSKSVYFGPDADINASAYGNFSFNAVSGLGTNIASQGFDYNAGQSTGNALGGGHRFYTSASGTSGSAANSLVKQFEISGSGNILVNSLQTGGTAPTTSGTNKMVTTDANGLLSFQAIPSGGGGSMVYPSTTGLAVYNGTSWGTSITDNSNNWNTAFGWGNHASAGYLTSTTGLLKANNLSDVASAATSRTNLGATTVGGNFFTLTNPSAITFPRINADNSVSTLSASAFLTAIGAQASGSYLTANQPITITATGDATGTSSSSGTAPSIALTIANNAVTNSKLAQFPATTMLGNKTGSAANATYLTPSDIVGMLPIFTSTTYGLTPLSGGGTTNFLRADGNWATPPSGSGMTYPAAGIPLSTGSAWGASITNNSSNWNTAYSWGNHALAGYLTSVPAQSWASITGKPSFATVATTGSYTDLINKPTIPAAQVQSDWNATSGMGVILNKPTFSYTLPTASTTVLGGVKVDGTTIGISSGVISTQLGTTSNIDASTYTPTVTYGSDITSVTVNNAAYTRIGSIITISIDFAFTVSATGAGNYPAIQFSTPTSYSACGFSGGSGSTDNTDGSSAGFQDKRSAIIVLDGGINFSSYTKYATTYHGQFIIQYNIIC